MKRRYLKFNELYKSRFGEINEDVYGSSGDGMGAITPSIPSSIPGDVAGATVGSGDVPNGNKMEIFGFDKDISKGRGFHSTTYKTFKDFLKHKKKLTKIYGNTI